MINHILSNPLDPWSWIAILFLLFTVVLPLLVIIAVSILVILLFRKLTGGLAPKIKAYKLQQKGYVTVEGSRSDVSNQMPSSESKSSPEELKAAGN